jgi:hypothetical protein
MSDDTHSLDPVSEAAPMSAPPRKGGLIRSIVHRLADAPGGRVAVQFHARDLNLVMGPAARGASIPFRVFLDGQPADGAYGADVNPDGRGIVGDQRTYQPSADRGRLPPAGAKSSSATRAWRCITSRSADP